MSGKKLEERHMNERLSIIRLVTRGINITDISKKMHIGRPAMSNFLNGKSKGSDRLIKCFESHFKITKGLLHIYDLKDRGFFDFNIFCKCRYLMNSTELSHATFTRSCPRCKCTTLDRFIRVEIQ